MWQDVENEQDYLNFSELAELAVDLIGRPNMLPLSLGVFGGWGSGKSTLLRLIDRELEAKAAAGDGSSYLVVRFDAWLFQGYDDARAALLEEIARHLAEAASDNESLVEKAGGLLKRVNCLRLLGAAADIGASLAFGVPTGGVLGRGLQGAVNFASGTPGLEDSASIGAAINDAAEPGRLMRPVQTPPTEIRAFRREFQEVVEGLDKTIVVFVDNLDRCLPAATIETLEAIRLFLFLPSTAFVVAADEAVIRHAVAKHYDGLSDRHVRDYLDKLIQIPMRAPRLGHKEVRAYMFLLFLSLEDLDQGQFEAARELLMKNLRSAWHEEPVSAEDVLSCVPSAAAELNQHLALAERLAPVLATAPNILGNPRIVKRLLNSLQMRLGLARRRGIPVDEEVLAKLAVLERGTDEDSYAFLIKLVVDDPDGTPALITDLEAAVGEDNWGELCPPEWKRHDSFIRLWVGLEPALAGRDLRSAVYLSRENVPLSTPPGELSYEAVQALTALRSVQSIRSVAAKNAVAALSPSERRAVLQGLISELRKVTTWARPVPGFNGALILVAETPEIEGDLRGFLETLPPEDVGKWILPLLRNCAGDWATDVLMRLGEAKDGPVSRPARGRKSTGRKPR